MNVRQALIALALGALIGFLWGFIGHYAHSKNLTPTDYPSANPRNSPDIAKWFSTLQNRVSVSCCGYGDAYEARILKEATPTEDGILEVIDTSAQDLDLPNGMTLHRGAIEDTELTRTFGWSDMVPEKYGNPLEHAIVFLSVYNGHISRMWCVVPLIGSQ